MSAASQPAAGDAGAELFVYYQVHRDVAAQAKVIAQGFQQRLRAAHPGLEARRLQRPATDEPLQTWMETYRLPGVGIGTALQAEIAAQAEPLARLTGERHLEVFIPCA